MCNIPIATTQLVACLQLRNCVNFSKNKRPRPHVTTMTMTNDDDDFAAAAAYDDDDDDRTLD